MNDRTIFLLLIAFFAAGAARADRTPELTALLKKTGAKEAIVKPARGILRHPYLVPSGPFHELFDWDTYFMGVALGDGSAGRTVADSTKDFLDFIGKNYADPGYIPRQIAPDGFWALPELCKPFLAQMALRASRATKDAAWLNEKGPVVGLNEEAKTLTYYEALKTYLAYWDSARRAPDGLYKWYSTWESGIDNSVVVSNEPKLSTEGVDLQVYLIREYRAMSVLAGALGRDEDALLFKKKAADLRRLMTEKMWSEKDGLFFNVDSATGKRVEGRQWTDLTPLWGDAATPAQADRMIREHLLNPAEFWAPHGVRTLAATDPAFRRNGYWRGPIWIVANYMMMRGLLDHGRTAEARELADKTVALVTADLKKTGGMNECYDPESGDPVASGRFVSWDLLAERMVEEARTGAGPTKDDFATMPAWPKPANSSR